MTSLASNRSRRLLLIGAAAWLVQPLYIATEFVAAHAARTPYSFVDDTISELGVRGCRTPGAFANVCSPRHDLMNGSFIVFGILVAVGALLLAHRFPPGRLTSAAVALWVASGVSSVAVGLVPLDSSEQLHALVALPVFAARPIALLLIGLTLVATRRAFGWSALIACAASIVGAVGFALVLGEPELTGAFERLALWPSDIWFAVAAIALVRTRPRA